MNVTDGRQTDGRATANSERELVFTFAKNTGEKHEVEVVEVLSATCNGRTHSDDIMPTFRATKILKFATQ